MALFLMRNKSLFYEHNITTKLLNLKLENDHIKLENDHILLENAFDIYKKMFDPIINIEPYDKIGINECSNSELFLNNIYLNMVKINFKLYLDKYKIYQSVTRWYWSQKRDNIFEKLVILFEAYKKVLDKVKLNYLRNANIFKKLLNDLLEFNNKLIEKLNILKNTYSDSVVSESIDKIIQMIILTEDLNNELVEDLNNELVEDLNNELIEDLNKGLVEDLNKSLAKDLNKGLVDDSVEEFDNIDILDH